MSIEIPTGEQLQDRYTPFPFFITSNSIYSVDVIHRKILSSHNKTENQSLAPLELTVFMLLLMHKNTVVTNPQILKDLYGTEEIDTAPIRVAVNSIRRKLMKLSPVIEGTLVTAYTFGYIWDEDCKFRDSHKSYIPQLQHFPKH